MSCFVVPAAEALITTVVAKVLESREKKCVEIPAREFSESFHCEPLYKKIRSLSKLLWGGSALLAFEHVWHGELAPFYPFLTQASDPEGVSEMIREMSTVGVSMSASVTIAFIAFQILGALSKRKKTLQAIPVESDR